MVVRVELVGELERAGVLGLPLDAVPVMVRRALLSRRLAEVRYGRVRLTDRGRELAARGLPARAR